MSQQVAMLRLESVLYTGGADPVQFSINLSVQGEQTELSLNLTPNVERFMSVETGGREHSSVSSVTIAVGTVASGTSGVVGPLTANTTTGVTVQPSPPLQTFFVIVPINSSFGPAGQIRFKYVSHFRPLPYCISPEWLCRYRYYLPIYYHWWCDGLILPDFYILTPVTVLTASMNDRVPDLNRINQNLALGYATPAASQFFPLLDYSMNVALAAGESVALLGWRDRFVLEDYSTLMDSYMYDYLGYVVRRYYPIVTPLCSKWRELLNCFCRICAQRLTLPTNIVSEYDSSVAPIIDQLYPHVVNLATTESVPFYFDPTLTDQCHKLRNIVAFFAYWCRRCVYTVPVSFGVLEPFYIQLYPTLATLNQMLENASLTICNPPEQDFCNRWFDVLNCLKLMCERKSSYDPSVVNAIESTFGTLVRSVYTYINYQPATSQAPGITNTCALISELLNFFTFICPEKALPGGLGRRSAFDNYLVQFETAMQGFVSQHGELCEEVEMENCTEWFDLLDCLDKICGGKYVMPDNIADDFKNGLETLIMETYNEIPKSGPPAIPPAPGPRGLDDICWMVAEIRAYIESVCPDGFVDTDLRDTLNAKLAALDAARTTLLSTYPDLCLPVTLFDVEDCEAWMTILDCLKRICGNREVYHSSILASFLDLFDERLHFLNWLYQSPTDYYPGPSGTMDLDWLCGVIESFRNSILGQCAIGDIDPIVKYRMDYELGLLQSAYATLTNYFPGICDTEDPVCEEWLRIFSCLVKLCDRRDQLSSDPETQGIVTALETGFGPHVDSLYATIYGGAPPGAFATDLDRICHEIHTIYDLLVAECGCGESTILDSMPNALNDISHFRAEYGALVPCLCGCLTDRLELSTGIADWTVTSSVNGGSFPRAANVLTSYGTLDAPLSGTFWISSINTASNSQTGDTVFEHRFRVCGDGKVRIVMEYWADDAVTIELDSQTLGSTSLPNSGVIDTVVDLTSGEHVIEATVTNNPAGNMGFNVKGFLEAACGNLVEDGDCVPSDPNPGDYEALCICCNPEPDCDTLWRLPHYVKLLCCGAQGASDPEYPGSLKTSVETLILANEVTFSRVILELGLNPSDFDLNSELFCTGYAHALSLLVLGTLRTRRLSWSVRYKLDCFRRDLDSLYDTYVSANPGMPSLCCSCDDNCEEWLALWRELCCIEGERRHLVDDGLIGLYETTSATFIEEVYGFVLGAAPGTQIPFYPADTSGHQSDRLRSAMEFFFMACLDCGLLTEPLKDGIASRLPTLRSLVEGLRTSLSGSLSGCCSPVFDEIHEALDCAMRLQLRWSEVPSGLRDLFQSEYTVPVNDLFAALPNVWSSGNPFDTGIVSELFWKTKLTLEEIDSLRSPFVRSDCTFRTSLLSIASALSDAHAALDAELNRLNLDFCSSEVDACVQIKKLPGYFGAFCWDNVPDPMATDVIAMESGLTLIGVSVSEIQRELRLSSVAYPSAGSFCTRLQFVTELVAIGFSRRSELSYRNRMKIDFFTSLYARRSASYNASFAGSRPIVRNRMTEYRTTWLNLLGCLCEACHAYEDLTPAQLAVSPFDAVEDLMGGEGTTRGAIDDLYMAVVASAPGLGLALKEPYCDDESDICRPLRVAISFFATWCLTCTEPDSPTESALETHLKVIRDELTLTRKAFADAGVSLCPDNQPVTADVQSSNLYLQAAGSTGADGSVPGVHLRWKMNGDLSRHLPKGNLTVTDPNYGSTEGLNKPDDFVRLFRTKYTGGFHLELDFANMKPNVSEVQGNDVRWRFDNVKADPQFAGSGRTVYLRFKDKPTYNALASGRNPVNVQSDVTAIINGYHSLLEVQVELNQRQFFAVEADVTGAGPTVRMEGVMLDESGGGIRELISFRKSLTGSGTHRIVSEGLRYVRFDCSGSLQKLRIETFEDFYLATKRRYGWSFVGDFGLSTDETEVFRRLDDPAHAPVHNNWPMFRDAAGPGKVNIANYQDRWDPDPGYRGREAEDGLLAGLDFYLKESTDKDKWRAMKELESLGKNLDQDPNDSNSDPDSIARVSLLELLNLAAQDFHVARMLGLGHIDWEVPLLSLGHNPNDKYLYMVEYVTVDNSVVSTPTTPYTHRYLSLPTGTADERLPLTPELDGYDLGLEKIDEEGAELTDASGYSIYGDTRFLRFNKKQVRFDLPKPSTFYGDTDLYSRGDETKPVRFGLLKREDGSMTWDMPDLNNDGADQLSVTPYLDSYGNAEAMPIPEQANPIMTVILRSSEDNGKDYEYAIYGVNWFSRAMLNDADLIGPVSNDFPKRNTILPPSNLNAQLIQDEPVPVLNSVYEQATVDAGGGSSLENMTRVTFDWNHLHNAAYNRATHADFLFRPSAPDMIRGEIDGTPQDTGTNQAVVTTKGYVDPSFPPEGGYNGKFVQPIVTGNLNRFVGSLLVAGDFRYPIVSVATVTVGGQPYARFTIDKVYYPPNTGDSSTRRPDIPSSGGWVAPLADEPFAVVENLSDAANWNSLSNVHVPLVDFTQAPFNQTGRVEQTTDRHGQTISRRVDGITMNAEITEIYVPDPDGGPDLPSGVYEIVFPSFTLWPQSGGDVGSAVVQRYWTGGTVRVELSNGEMKPLTVAKIELNSDDPSDIKSPLTVKAIDPAAGDPSYPATPEDGERVIPADGTMHVKLVNYHPSYRVYLDLSNAGLTLSSDVMPQGEEDIRQTFIAAYAYEHETTPTVINNDSAPSAPAVHIARSMSPPPTFGQINGWTYASRPDFYGKSTYTFDVVKDGADPYAMVFYRGNQLAVLRALYKPSTIQSILASLPARNDDDYFQARWSDLVECQTVSNLFKDYGDGVPPFPNPDKYEGSSYQGEFEDFDGTNAPGTMVDLVRRAIIQNFLPLTERPVIYRQIDDSTLDTSSAKPTLRDSNGEPLPPTDPAYDPFPMVRRGTYGLDYVVRFTDYTLDGASRDIYFYTAQGVSNSMVPGWGNMILGPVQLIDAYPPEAPEIRAIGTQQANPVLEEDPAVTISVTPYADADNIVALRVYRTTDAAMAKNIRSMTKLADYTLPDPGIVADPDTRYTVIDDFSDIPVPFGVPIYYRVTAVRNVSVKGSSETVESEPSKTMLVTMLDTANPDAPTITYQAGTIASGLLPDVELSWSETTTNGTYRLYKRNDSGEWRLLQTYNPGDTLFYDAGDLEKENNGKDVFHHFKVTVTNVSGFSNVQDNVLTI